MDVKEKFKKVKEYYNQSPTSSSYNFLIYGDTGVGKTTLIPTCRKPILVHSFDPGGMKSIIDVLDEDWIAVDTTFEKENPVSPWVYDAWIREMMSLERDDIFSQLGTFVIDSATTWAQDIMNKQLKDKGRPGVFPFQEDYGPQMARIENHLRTIASYPCDVLITAHEDSAKDERTGRIFIGPLLTGKLKTRVPLLFDEVYSLLTENAPKGVIYNLLTQNDGLRKARTRLGRKGIFDKFESPNISNLLKKAGVPLVRG